MDTIFNLELLRSVYVFKDLNSSIKDVNTSLEKTTSSIRSLSDSFSSFTKSSVEKVKDLSTEFRKLTKNITEPKIAKISYNTTGAISEITKVSAAAQNFSQISYKENLSKSTKITQPNQDASGQEKDTKEEGDSSFLSKAQEVMLKIKDVADTFNSVYDVLDKLKIINRQTATSLIPEMLPAAAEGGGLTLMQRILPRIMPMITSISTGLEGIMASVGVAGEALLAIPGVNVIVAIAAAIIALIIAVKLLMEHSRSFNQMLGYIGGAGRAVFHNIGVYATRIWQLVIKPIIEFIVSGFQSIFSTIWEVIVAIWGGIVSIVSGIWEFIVGVYNAVVEFTKTIWEVFVSIFQGIWDFIVGVWGNITELFSGFKTWIYTNLLEPLMDAFSGVWDWIKGLIDGIINRLSSLFEPVKKLLRQIFSSKGTLNIHQEGLKGAEKAEKDFDVRKGKRDAEKLLEEKKDAENKNSKSKTDKTAGSSSVFSNHTKQLDFKNFGASALSNVQSRNSAFGGKGSMSGDSGMGGQKSVGNLNITKLIENMNIYNQNSTMSKDAIIQMVREALLTAVADFTLAQKDTY
ncbi:hypothetical protein [Chryseobacterium sp. G0201]|uniref:phage tail protein n=1 Tax=Chryseobacterium sp. G0201 TaxID=2487065 RepID=UPI000F5151D7|nr:hypothetical protein [Chryseobacterium sp. G0201]